MAKQVSHEEVFTRFIEDQKDAQGIVKYDQAISEMGIKGLNSLVIDFNDLYNYDIELASDLLKEPERALEIFARVV